MIIQPSAQGGGATAPDPFGPASGGAPGVEVALDMVRRGVLIGPFVVAATWLVSDGSTALSVGYGLVLILLNFLLSAYLLSWAARISIGLIASVALGGYAVRLALIFAAVWYVRETSWVRMVPLGITIIVAHLGLLFLELRHVSATMAHPGLKPGVGRQRRVSRNRSKPAAGYRTDRHRNTALRSSTPFRRATSLQTEPEAETEEPSR